MTVRELPALQNLARTSSDWTEFPAHTQLAFPGNKREIAALRTLA
jgi:hypothetical protein